MFYRVDHPLAVRLIQTAISRQLPTVCLTFDYRAHGAKIAALEKFIGQSGWLELSKLTVQSLDTEEFLVFAARTDDGASLDGELCRKLMGLPARIGDSPAGSVQSDALAASRNTEVANFLKTVETRNGRFFDEEVGKLERWSDDLKLGLEREIKDLDQQIKDARRETQGVSSLVEKLEGQKKRKGLEADRSRKRRELYDAQDAIDLQRGELIANIEKQLDRRHQLQPLFAVRWSLK